MAESNPVVSDEYVDVDVPLSVEAVQRILVVKIAKDTLAGKQGVLFGTASDRVVTAEQIITLADYLLTGTLPTASGNSTFDAFMDEAFGSEEDDEPEPGPEPKGRGFSLSNTTNVDLYADDPGTGPSEQVQEKYPVDLQRGDYLTALQTTVLSFPVRIPADDENPERFSVFTVGHAEPLLFKYDEPVQVTHP